jgi:hypothetical protein
METEKPQYTAKDGINETTTTIEVDFLDLASLPEGVIEVVMQHLPFPDLMRLRGTCKKLAHKVLVMSCEATNIHSIWERYAIEIELGRKRNTREGRKEREVLINNSNKPTVKYHINRWRLVYLNHSPLDKARVIAWQVFFLFLFYTVKYFSGIKLDII